MHLHTRCIEEFILQYASTMPSWKGPDMIRIDCKDWECSSPLGRMDGKNGECSSPLGRMDGKNGEENFVPSQGNLFLQKGVYSSLLFQQCLAESNAWPRGVFYSVLDNKGGQSPTRSALLKEFCRSVLLRNSGSFCRSVLLRNSGNFCRNVLLRNSGSLCIATYPPRPPPPPPPPRTSIPRRPGDRLQSSSSSSNEHPEKTW